MSLLQKMIRGFRLRFFATSSILDAIYVLDNVKDKNLLLKPEIQQVRALMVREIIRRGDASLLDD